MNVSPALNIAARRFADQHGVAADVRSLAYLNLWLRSPNPRLPPPDFRTWYRGPGNRIIPCSEPGLWVPLSCAVAIIDSKGATASAGAGSTTSNTVDFDTSGATLIVVGVGCRANGTIATNAVTDSAGNSFVAGALTLYGPNGDGLGYARLFYKFSPTTSGTHHWSATGGDYISMAVSAFTGTEAASSGVGDSGNNGTGSLAPGSLTPAATGDLFATFVYFMFADPTIATFTRRSHANFGNGGGYGIADYVSPDGGAQNPTWSGNASGDTVAAAMATFKAAGGGGGGSTAVPVFMNQYRQRRN